MIDINDTVEGYYPVKSEGKFSCIGCEFLDDGKKNEEICEAARCRKHTRDDRESVIFKKVDKMKSEKKIEEFEALKRAAMPLIKYMIETHQPHMTAHVTATSVELVEGFLNIPNIEVEK